jgi:hypothetical protein
MPQQHLHPGASSHKDTPPGIYSSHMHRYRYLSRGMPRSHPPARLVPMTRRKILPDRLNPHHTPKTHARISPIITTLLAPRALTTHKQYSTEHHITDIMHSRTVVRKRATSLTAGMQGYRLCQGKGSQAILPCNLS